MADPARRASPADVETSRERILVAAERIIAERGPAVPLREIALAAEQKNNSAVQYYFGDRDGLVAAVVAFRLASLEAARLERLASLEAAGKADDPAELVGALVDPMIAIPLELHTTHYARFLEQVRSHPAVRDAARSPAVRVIAARLDRAAAHLPSGLRAFRLGALTTALFAWLADRERAIESGAFDAESDALACADLRQLLVTLLLAPAPNAPRPAKRAARSKPTPTGARRTRRAP